VDPEEWRRPTAGVMTDFVLGHTRPGSIIWLHDTLGVETVRALEAVLTALAADGYRFETISELIRRR
jgi:peptidoglycan/xylan/chitin deacetylase (PgdA/CDA1 family)